MFDELSFESLIHVTLSFKKALDSDMMILPFGKLVGLVNGILDERKCNEHVAGVSRVGRDIGSSFTCTKGPYLQDLRDGDFVVVREGEDWFVLATLSTG